MPYNVPRSNSADSGLYDYLNNVVPTTTTSPEWERIAAKYGGKAGPAVTGIAFNRKTNPQEDQQIQAAETAAMPYNPGPLASSLGADWNTLTSAAMKPRMEFNGNQLITRQFNQANPGGGTQLLSTETTQNIDPMSIARQMAGAYGTPKDYLPKAYDQYNKTVAGLTGMLGEQRLGQQGAQELALRGELGRGDLGLRQRELDMKQQQAQYTMDDATRGQQQAILEYMKTHAGEPGAGQKALLYGKQVFEALTQTKRAQAESRVTDRGPAESFARPGSPPPGPGELPTGEQEILLNSENPLSSVQKLVDLHGKGWVANNWDSIKSSIANTKGGLNALSTALEPNIIGSMLGQTGQAIGALQPWAASNWWTQQGRDNLRRLARTPLQESMGQAFGSKNADLLGFVRQLQNRQIR